MEKIARTNQISELNPAENKETFSLAPVAAQLPMIASVCDQIAGAADHVIGGANSVGQADTEPTFDDINKQLQEYLRDIFTNPSDTDSAIKFLDFLTNTMGSLSNEWWISLTQDQRTLLTNLLKSTFSGTEITAFKNIDGTCGIKIHNLGELVAYMDVFNYYYSTYDVNDATDASITAFYKFITDRRDKVEGSSFFNQCDFLQQYKNALDYLLSDYDPKEPYHGHVFFTFASREIADSGVWYKCDNAGNKVDKNYNIYKEAMRDMAALMKTVPYPSALPDPLDPLDPVEDSQDDPNLDTDIPYTDAAHTKIDYDELERRLCRIFTCIRTNDMNHFAAEEAYTFLVNLKNIWNQIPKDAKDATGANVKGFLTSTLNQDITISEKDWSAFGLDPKTTHISSLGELVGYEMCFYEFYKNNDTKISEEDRIKAVQNKINSLMKELNDCPSDFNCSFLKNMQSALNKLQAMMNDGSFKTWADNHWTVDGCLIDMPDGTKERADSNRFLWVASGYMGTFLLKDKENGNYQSGMGAWERNYYHQLIQNIFNETHNPFVQLMLLLNLLNDQNDGKQEEIVGANIPGKYLGKEETRFTDSLNLLLKWRDTDRTDPSKIDSAEVQKFFRTLQDAKILISSDADISPQVRTSMLSNIQAILDLRGNKSIEITKEYFHSNVFGSDQVSLDNWKTVNYKFTQNMDTCKDQTNIDGQIGSNEMTNLNEIMGTEKNMFTSVIEQINAIVKNQKTA